MTAYFDGTVQAIGVASRSPRDEAHRRLNAIEFTLLQDCGLALELPTPLGEPWVSRFDALVLTHAVAVRPDEAPPIDWGDLSGDEEGELYLDRRVQELLRLVEGCHDLWHDLKDAGVMHDDPRDRLGTVWAGVETRWCRAWGLDVSEVWDVDTNTKVDGDA